MSYADNRREQLSKRHAEESERLERELYLLSALPDRLMSLDHMAHIHMLWDRVASLHFKFHRYESLRKGQPDPVLADVLLQLDTFPAVDLAVFRDGCVSIRTLADAYREHEQAQSRMAGDEETSATVTPIAPFWLTFDADSSQEMAIHYIGQTSLGLVEMVTTFPLHGDIARQIAHVGVRYSTGNNRYDPEREQRIASSSLEIMLPFRQLGDARAETINFASGSPTVVGSKVLYYCSWNGEPANLSLADVIRAIEVSHV